MKRNKGHLFVVSAPAGTGKTTLVRMVVGSDPKRFVQSTSCTTRPPRRGEIDGNHYHFISREAFERYVEQDAFLEWATVFGQLYGTLASHVEQLRNEGKHVFLVIDTQGMQQLMERDIDGMTTIFIRPPSVSALRDRLQGRRSETQERIEERLSAAKRELACAANYDYTIINDELQTAYEELQRGIKESIACTNT